VRDNAVELDAEELRELGLTSGRRRGGYPGDFWVFAALEGESRPRIRQEYNASRQTLGAGPDRKVLTPLRPAQGRGDPFECDTLAVTR
jgi:hypothetical protein